MISSIYIKLERKGTGTQSTQDYYTIAQYLKDSIEEVSAQQGKPIQITKVIIKGFTKKGLRVDYEYTSPSSPQVLGLEGVFVSIVISLATNWKFWASVIVSMASLILLLKALNMRMSIAVGNTKVTIDPGENNDDIITDPEEDEEAETNNKEGVAGKLVGWMALVAAISKLAGAW